MSIGGLKKKTNQFYRIGQGYLNSRVPTVVLASNGVKRKWFLGLTTITSNFFLSIALRTAKLAQPVPRIITFFLPLDTCNHNYTLVSKRYDGLYGQANLM